MLYYVQVPPDNMEQVLDEAKTPGETELLGVRPKQEDTA